MKKIKGTKKTIRVRVRSRWRPTESMLQRRLVGWRVESVELHSHLRNPGNTLLGWEPDVGHRMSVVLTDGKARKRLTIRSDDVNCELL